MQLSLSAALGTTPQSALHYLRHLSTINEVVTWEILENIASLHFEGLVNEIEKHFKIRNSTGLSSLFQEAASKLVVELPQLLTSEHCTDQECGVRQAHLVILLRKSAGALELLHQREAVRYDFT